MYFCKIFVFSFVGLFITSLVISNNFLAFTSLSSAIPSINFKFSSIPDNISFNLDSIFHTVFHTVFSPSLSAVIQFIFQFSLPYLLTNGTKNAFKSLISSGKLAQLRFFSTLLILSNKSFICDSFREFRNSTVNLPSISNLSLSVVPSPNSTISFFINSKSAWSQGLSTRSVAGLFWSATSVILIFIIFKYLC